MSNVCGTSGGKGNFGMFIERDRNICAAGVASSQAGHSVRDVLQQYLLQDEVEALIRDSIPPPPKPQKLAPVRHPPELDMRYAGPFSQAAALINPPMKSKVQTLMDDFKETSYKSYWKKITGHVPDPVPYLPEGFDVHTTMGKKLPDCGRLYDIVMPKAPKPRSKPSKEPGYQTNRNYCESYNPNIIFGIRYNADPRGKWAKCCLTDSTVLDGTYLKKPLNTKQANYIDAKRAELGVPNAPYNNISFVPEGYPFGKPSTPPNKLEECLTTCELNPNVDFFRKCMAHLNTLRKFMSKRFEPTFFQQFYLSLKCYDSNKSGWLPKEVIYNCCKPKYIRFNSALIEPLLSIWNAFNGSEIKYETFIFVLNFTQPTPKLPKIMDIPEDCIDYRTTYTEMVKAGQEIDKRHTAGLPSGRYFDMDYPVTPQGYCKADRFYLPHETNVRANLCPSVYTLFGISHRDMYAKREPEVIRKVFKAAGDTFRDEEFEKIWTNAKKYHSQGWVSFETFRRSKLELESEGTGKNKHVILEKI